MPFLNASTDYAKTANDYPGSVSKLASGRQTPFDVLASGVSEVRLIEQRLCSLMDRLVGSGPESAGDPQPPREPGLLGDVGEAGRDLCRTADAMGRYITAIERALP